MNIHYLVKIDLIIGLFVKDEQSQNNVAFFFQDTIAQKCKFPIKRFFTKCYQTRNTTDLVTFTEEFLTRKLNFLCSVSH